MKYALRIATILTVFAACGCNKTGPMVLQTELAEILEAQGFALYTPFRSDDKPGTIFVFSPDYRGVWREFTVSVYSDTFAAREDELFDKNGQQLEFLDEYTNGETLSASIGFELVSVLIHPELATKYAETVHVRLLDPKIHLRMTDNHLERLSSRLSSETRRSLDRRLRDGSIEHVYMVRETLQVAGIEAKVTLKSEFTGDLGLEKIQEIAKLNASVSKESETVISVVSKGPLLIGHKSITLPSSLVDPTVGIGGEVTFEKLSAADVREIKSK